MADGRKKGYDLLDVTPKEPEHKVKWTPSYKVKSVEIREVLDVDPNPLNPQEDQLKITFTLVAPGKFDKYCHSCGRWVDQDRWDPVCLVCKSCGPHFTVTQSGEMA